MSPAQVLIVGAGPTGLVLALRLAHHGIPFRIIDKNSGPGQASRAMVVHARTLEFYRQLGFADEVVAAGIKMHGVHFREGGEEVARVEFGDIGGELSPFPFVLCYPQDDHERFLIGKLGALGVEVEWNTELKQFTQTEDDVQAVLEKNGTEDVCRVAYLGGCDGGHSRVREGLGVKFPGGTYEQTFFVADVKVAGEPNNEFFINIGERDFCLLLPVRSSGMKRLIGTVPKEQDGKPGLTFADIQPHAERVVNAQVVQVNWFSTYHVHHRVASHFRVGRAFLAGDAGHVHSPAGGQGMNTGIGDAVNLSWKLADVLRGRANPSILDTYEVERIAFARTLVATTDAAFRRIVDRGFAGQVVRHWLLPNLLPFLAGFSAARQLMFRTVSQTRINYHGSALSRGHAGEVQGGDRLPWVSSPDGDNFASLKTLTWQVHVYGEATPSLREEAAKLGLDLHAFAWTDEADRAGLQRDAFYLIRPDGYVALASPDQNARSLRDFAAGLGLDLVQSGETTA